MLEISLLLGRPVTAISTHLHRLSTFITLRSDHRIEVNSPTKNSPLMLDSSFFVRFIINTPSLST